MAETKSVRYTSLIAIEAAFLLLISLFFSIVWEPVFLTINSDIALSDTAFLLIWDFLKELLTYFFYWLFIAFLAVSLLRFGWKGSFPLFGLFLFGSVLRSVGTAISSAIILQDFAENFAENMKSAVWDIVFDALFLAAFCLIFYLIAMRKRNSEERSNLLPPAKNGFRPLPLHISVCICIGIYYAVQRLLGRIIYDIYLGAPTNGADLAWMIFYYVADLVFAVVGYFVVLLILKLLTKEKTVNKLFIH